MATLTPIDEFSDVYSLDTSDPVKGGPVSGPVDAPTDGQANAQAQALANRTEYLYNRLLPAGVIVPYGGTSAPDGWIMCHGASLLRSEYPELFSAIGTAFGEPNLQTFRVPDFRGRFLRGVDGSAGLDPDSASRTAMNGGGNTGNAVGSVQDDAFEAHSHNVNIVDQQSGTGLSGYSQNVANPTNPTSSTGGNETRPKNAYVNYIIWAGR